MTLNHNTSTELRTSLSVLCQFVRTSKCIIESYFYTRLHSPAPPLHTTTTRSTNLHVPIISSHSNPVSEILCSPHLPVVISVEYTVVYDILDGKSCTTCLLVNPLPLHDTHTDRRQAEPTRRPAADRERILFPHSIHIHSVVVADCVDR